MAILSRLVPILAKRKVKVIDDILNNPIALTEAKLDEIIERHSNTLFGKDHGYSTITTPEQFTEQVPLFDYQSMSPYFERVKQTPNLPIITADPVIWYVQSSGSTGNPKALPVSKAGMDDYTAANSLLLWSFVNANKEHAKMLDGTLLTFAAPARLGEINGVPLGYMTGISREMIANRILKGLVKPGEEVFNMTDMNEKLWAYAKYAVQENITGLAGITTLALAFVRKMKNEYGLRLLNHFSGTKYEHKVRDAMNDDGTLDLNTLWPNLSLLMVTGIDSDPYKSWIKETLPNAFLMDNYAGSEGYYGTSLQPNIDNGIQLLPNLHYFEFISEREMEKEDPKVIPLSEVKKGHRYEVVITNLLGYTRYRVGDMLTFLETDPYSVHRIGRKGKSANLAGEKLTDAHVNNGIAEACRATSASISDYTVIGQVNENRARYTILLMPQNEVDLEEFARAFDEAVSAKNGEFKYVLEFGALDPTVAVKMETSYTESIIKNNHIQAKSLPLSVAESA